MTMAAPPARNGDHFHPARELFEEMVGWARSTGPTDHSEMESAIEERGRELLRQLYQAWYDTLAAVEKREAEGVPMPERTRVSARGRQLESTLGRVHPVRLEYRRAGEKGRLPLDARLNLPARLYCNPSTGGVVKPLSPRRPRGGARPRQTCARGRGCMAA